MDEEKNQYCSPLVSVVIPTFNSEATIKHCLRSISDQTYPNIEVIVVDKYSNDKTAIIAKEFNARVLHSSSERSGAKNQGATHAHGYFVLFLDSDMELTPSVIEKCVNLHFRDDIVAVDIPEVSVVSNFWDECRSIEKASLIADRFLDIPRFFSKRIFFKVGSFDERLVCGEDADLCARCKSLGHKFGKINAEIRHHEGGLSLENIIVRALHYGKSLPIFIKKEPLIALRRYGYIRWMRLRNLKIWSRYPRHFLGFVFMKLVEYIAYLCGFLTHLL